MIDKRQTSSTVFYFQYQMRIQFIPYIEQEIAQFIETSAILTEPNAIRQRLFLARKRITEIDRFFHQHWNDYRIHQILRAKQMLESLCATLHPLLQASLQIINDVPSQPVIAPERISEPNISPPSISPGRSIQDPAAGVRMRLQTEHLPIKKIMVEEKKKPPESSRSKIEKGEIQKVTTVKPEKQQEVGRQSTSRDKLQKSSSKLQPSPPAPARKMTKEQYIALLRSKK